MQVVAITPTTTPTTTPAIAPPDRLSSLVVAVLAAGAEAEMFEAVLDVALALLMLLAVVLGVTVFPSSSKKIVEVKNGATGVVTRG